MVKVSVVIAAYNAMRYLPEAINSVLGQSFDNYEIVLVDDGSQDNIKSWITATSNQKLRFYSQTNLGPSSARNLGLAKAKGEYIAFLDADDLWREDKLEKQVLELEEYPEVGLVYSWLGSIDEQSKVGGKIRKNNHQGYVLEKLIEHDMIECGSVPLIRKECFDSVGIFDSSIDYAQTWDMWLRIAKKYEFRVIKEPLAFYRAHPDNRSKDWTKMEASYRGIIAKNLNEPEYDDLKKRALSFAFLRIAWKILQANKKFDTKVLRFQMSAVKVFPKALFSQQSILLSCALLMITFSGYKRYQSFRRLFRSFNVS